MPIAGPNASDPALRAVRSERLLACFQKAFNHDLPNQLVTLQGLVQLLEFEEKSRLSSEGKEYLLRLGAAARRSLDTILLMRDLQKLTAGLEIREAISLADLVPDVLNEIKPLFPTMVLDCRHSFQEPTVIIGKQALFRALVQLARLAVALARCGKGTLELGSRSTPHTKDVWISLEETTPSGSQGVLAGAEKRYEFLVARELAESWGGTLTQEGGPAGPRFVLKIPA